MHCLAAEHLAAIGSVLPEAQQNASRRNGTRSNGPVTPEGKAKSAVNGTTHGLFSDTILLKKESREAWNRLCADLTDRFQPADNVERNIIFEMATANWRAQRAIAMEAAIINMETDVIDLAEAPARTTEDELRRAAEAYYKAVGRDKAIVELGRQSIRLNNLWMRLHKKPKQLQQDRKAAEAEDPREANQKSKSEPEKPETPEYQKDTGPQGGNPNNVHSRRKKKTSHVLGNDTRSRRATIRNASLDRQKPAPGTPLRPRHGKRERLGHQ